MPFEFKVDKWYWESLFAFMRDLFAKNRGMLFGNEDIRFSKQLED